ncbi:MAG: hypothetical protein C9356_12055 [Oleiphilus sp.]|nr:MAG: hypothetical protein C9356_12055 [Oleiphilus sp.]
MYLTNIESRKDYKDCLALTSEIPREFLYDCGSTSEAPLGYTTTTFKEHLSVDEVPNQTSKCIGVYTDTDIELESEGFDLPDCSMSMPFEQLGYFKWLQANAHTKATGHRIEDKRHYLASLGFVRGRDKLTEDQLTILRHAHDAFWSAQVHNSGTCREDTLSPHLAELAMMIPDGEWLRLPQTPLKHYAKIKGLLTTAGGTYRKNAFCFSGKDAGAVQSALLDGRELNDKKKYQFFETPPELVALVMEKLSLQAGERWLEPSAGQGALANAALVRSEHGVVVELMPENAQALRAQDYQPIVADFLALGKDELGQFDKICANPPFTNNQDCAHIRKMYDCHLKPRGRLVSFASTSWMHGSQKTQIAFRKWLDEVGAEVQVLESGAFKSSGTSVATTLITINNTVNGERAAA